VLPGQRLRGRRHHHRRARGAPGPGRDAGAQHLRRAGPPGAALGLQAAARAGGQPRLFRALLPRRPHRHLRVGPGAEGGARRDPRLAGGTMNTPRHGLSRPLDDRVLAGVIGGVARRFGWNSTLARVLYVVVSVLSAAFPGILVYLVLWLLMPEDD